MSNFDQGVLVFGKDGGPEKSTNQYDSRNGRLQADLTRTPPHMAIVDDFPGGTALTSSGAGDTIREVLLRIPHHLPFTPEAIVYFYSKSYNGSITDIHAGTFGGNILFYSSASGTINDVVFIEVDDQELRIVHETTSYSGTPYTSDANKYLLRLKYYIFSNDSHVDNYAGGTILT